MSDILREQSKWARERTKTLTPYIHESKSLFSTVAGRGFKVIPGFLYDLHNSLELGVKSKLSDANFAILTETIERELKQSGIDYGLAYKNAVIVWELEKQSLMDAWGNEYALIKQAMKQEDEVVARLGIALYARQVYLIEQKTIIEEDAEDLRNQIASLGTDVAEAESLLAAQKILTANKKLEVIPTLQLILAQELQLIAALQTKNSGEEDLIDALQEVADKKLSDLLPILAQLATEIEKYQEELAIQRQLQKDIASLRRDIAEQEAINVGKDGDENSRKGIALARKLLDDKITSNEAIKLSIDNIRRNLQFELTSLESGSGYLRTWMADEKADQATINITEKTDDATYKGKKDIARGLDQLNRVKFITDTSTNAGANADPSKIKTIASTNAAEQTGVATIRALTEITSKLTHLLSQ
jgi:hypothetical protein